MYLEDIILGKQARHRETGTIFPLSYVEAKRSRAEKIQLITKECDSKGKEGCKRLYGFLEHSRCTYTTLQLIDTYN